MRFPKRSLIVILTFICTSVCCIEQVGFSFDFTRKAPYKTHLVTEFLKSKEKDVMKSVRYMVEYLVTQKKRKKSTGVFLYQGQHDLSDVMVQLFNCLQYSSIAADATKVNQSSMGAILSTFYHGYACSQVLGGWAAQKHDCLLV
ncbi:hypothetical protein QN277_028731 [Acacia crassicarpa]|uniref:Uncharacterized protein n=1 Tax=Acacia crassicarpa TaxID=499986 RepID=A0AAE1J6M5_9FABA|nr:hypothetical protein QN277_028731 [Acacia crassicarpa]